MFETVQVVGAGRVGSALSARLADAGIRVCGSEPLTPTALVVLAVPDSAIADAARAVEPGPWIAHVSGATPLSALDPHTRRFSVHPLQTFARGGGPEQLDGAFAAVTADTDEARARALWLARTLGLVPFELDDAARALYHAGAVLASPGLVALHRAAAALLEAAGAPPDALVPLMRRTIENGFDLTGPAARGDWETVDANRAAIRAAHPELEPLYDALTEAALA